MHKSAIMSAMATAVRLIGELDPRAGWTAERCTIAKAIEVLSTRSALLIMREAFYGTTRFDDFAERVGLSEPAAAARLRELVDDGLLEREDYREPGQRTRQQYRLTDKGRDLAPAVLGMYQWGARHLSDDRAPHELSHVDCGAAVRVEVTCDAGHQVPLAELRVSRPAPRRQR